MPPFALVLATPALALTLNGPMLDTVGPGFLAAPDQVVEMAGTLPLPSLLQIEAADSSGPASDEAEADRRFGEAVRQRNEIGTVHRALGIVTWAAMTVTNVLGFIQFYNLYGFGAGINGNPCVTGNAVFGQDQCYGSPWAHRVGWITTTALYTATLSLSIGLLLNDPYNLLGVGGVRGDKMRAHSVLAIIHLAGMVAQMFFGLGFANGWFGDRTNDYGAIEGAAIAHQIIGWTTWASLGAAGALMLF